VRALLRYEPDKPELVPSTVNSEIEIASHARAEMCAARAIIDWLRRRTLGFDDAAASHVVRSMSAKKGRCTGRLRCAL